ncbi:hypothetical protein CSUI_003518 [Cystoisospora suis]|uniref:Uncharacterized protein n=1 Tax=Cystoisospora suis TaxID=483139 RepID=A0A2C6L4M7_9APIC|nr:hypothetical protein CSUI_003518 [Cystoisospora suis]
MCMKIKMTAMRVTRERIYTSTSWIQLWSALRKKDREKMLTEEPSSCFFSVREFILIFCDEHGTQHEKTGNNQAHSLVV